MPFGSQPNEFSGALNCALPRCVMLTEIGLPFSVMVTVALVKLASLSEIDQYGNVT